MNLLRTFLWVVLSFAAVRSHAVTPLFSDDFESGDANRWSAVYQASPGTRLNVVNSLRWSGNSSGQITIDAPASTLKLEASFPSAPRIYLRAGFYLDPAFKMGADQWLVVLGPANTSVGVLDKLFLKKRSDGKFIISSQSSGDGSTVVKTGEWVTLEAMFAPGDGNGESSFWVNGTLQKSKTNAVFKTPADSIMAGALEPSWNSSISGTFYLDDVVVSTERVGVLAPGLVLHHPELRGRAGAKFQAVLSGWQSNWQFSATLTGADTAITLHDLKALSAGTFHIPVQLSGLKRGDYTITALLKDQTGAERGRWTGAFTKNYDKEARMTIDSDNNILLDGKLFFPVTAFGLHETLIAEWAKQGYINCLFGQNWWQPTTETWRAYTQLGAAHGLPSIGPLNLAAEHRRIKADVEEHVLAARNDPNTVAYTFIDEPDYNGYPTSEMGEWFRLSKQLDGSRLVHLNLMGSDFVGGGANLKIGKDWTYPNLYADIYAFDMYPMWKAVFSIASLGDAADNLMKFNRGLIPFFAFVQTCNVEPSDPVSRAPSAAEMRVMAWELVIHGAKGIQWYHFGAGTSPECYAGMAAFTQQITEYTPILLSAVPAPAIDSPQTKGLNAPISLTSRQFSGKTYIFAVNTTGQARPFQCSVARMIKGSRFGVAGSEATIVYGDTYLEDTLPPYEVRIYYSKRLDAPTNLKATPQ